MIDLTGDETGISQDPFHRGDPYRCVFDDVVTGHRGVTGGLRGNWWRGQMSLASRIRRRMLADSDSSDLS